MSYNHCIDFAFVFNSEYSVRHYHVQRRAAEASMITAVPVSASGNALRCTIFTKPTGGGSFCQITVDNSGGAGRASKEVSFGAFSRVFKNHTIQFLTWLVSTSNGSTSPVAQAKAGGA